MTIVAPGAASGTIARLAERADTNALWPAIEEIFFLSSATRHFESAEARRRFLERWTGHYRENEPEDIYLALDADDRVIGYLMGCRDSRSAKRLFRDIDSYALFADLFESYPAHFHVNCHPRFRGRGIGRGLVTAFVAACRKDGVTGIHLVTAADAPNLGFYTRLGFDERAARRWQDRDLLFLGRRL